MIRATLIVAAIITWIIWPNPPAPPAAAAPPDPATVAARYQAADQIDRSTRDPLTEPSPFVTPTNPPPPPEPEPAPAPTPDVSSVSPPTDTTQTPTGSLPSLLLTIRANESGGNYQAFNPTGCEGSGCGGAYQLHAGYASGWATEAGYPGMPGNAALWPPATQDAVALHKFYATNPDGALWCSWTDYC